MKSQVPMATDRLTQKVLYRRLETSVMNSTLPQTFIFLLSMLKTFFDFILLVVIQLRKDSTLLNFIHLQSC